MEEDRGDVLQGAEQGHANVQVQTNSPGMTETNASISQSASAIALRDPAALQQKNTASYDAQLSSAADSLAGSSSDAHANMLSGNASQVISSNPANHHDQAPATIQSTEESKRPNNGCEEHAAEHDGIVSQKSSTIPAAKQDIVAIPLQQFGGIPTGATQTPFTVPTSSYQSPYGQQVAKSQTELKKQRRKPLLKAKVSTQLQMGTSHSFSATGRNDRGTQSLRPLMPSQDTARTEVTKPYTSPYGPVPPRMTPFPIDHSTHPDSGTLLQSSSLPASTQILPQSSEPGSSRTQAHSTAGISNTCQLSLSNPSVPTGLPLEKASTQSPVSIATPPPRRSASLESIHSVQSRHESQIIPQHRPQNPSSSQASASRTLAADNYQTVESTGRAPEASAGHSLNQPGRARRRTAVEMQELHAQRDRAGLPRLKQYPKNMVVVTSTDGASKVVVDVDKETSQDEVSLISQNGRSGDFPDIQVVGSATTVTPAKRGRPKKVVSEPALEGLAIPRKRGRPRKVRDEDGQTPQTEATPAKRGRPRKRPLDDLNDDQIDDVPLQKKRAYTKKAKQIAPDQPASDELEQSNPWAQASEHLYPRSGPSRHHEGGLVPHLFTQSQTEKFQTIHEDVVRSQSPVQRERYDTQPPSLYPEIPTMHTASNIFGTPRRNSGSSIGIELRTQTLLDRASNNVAAHQRNNNYTVGDPEGYDMEDSEPETASE